MHEPADPIDQVLALDLGGRGIGRLFIAGAALAAARALLGARRVLIVTGFCVPPGTPETDGLPGAAALGRALRRTGARVRYVTDPAVAPPLAAVLGALDEPADVETGPDPPALLARDQPTHLVAIERPGRARGGDYLSMRGESVAAWNRPLDELFLLSASPRRASPPPRRAPGSRRAGGAGGRPVTIGVGDGGNEIGMGNLAGPLARQGGVMARIASRVRVDHLVVAGTSNWGAYGIVAGLSRLRGEVLLHSPELEGRMLEACVEAGAVDGITRRAEPTVDGLPRETHQAIVELLLRAAPPAAARRAAIRARAVPARPGSSIMGGP